MRTKEEKDQMVEAIKRQKADLPEFSMFGDANWEQADAQIRVIQEDLNEDEIRDEWDDTEDDEDDNGVVSAALDAESWMLGDMDSEDLIDSEYLS